jgi:nucleoid-associated protein YgaU
LTQLLRAAVVFVLGVALGLAWVLGGRDPEGGEPASALEGPSLGAGARRPDAVLGPDWGRVVVRASTGREPLLEERAAPTRSVPELLAPGPADVEADGEAGTEDRDPHPGEDPLPPFELPDFELEVRAGQTLSQIAYAHYGTAPEALVKALATYNGLSDPDALRAGRRLLLPDRSKLAP